MPADTPTLTPEERATGWVEWHGGENPCRADYKAPVKFRDGLKAVAQPSCEWTWAHWAEPHPRDIVAYLPEHPQVADSLLTDADKAKLRDLLPAGDPLRAKLGEPERTFEKRVGAPWMVMDYAVVARNGDSVLISVGRSNRDDIYEVLRTASTGPDGYALAKAVAALDEMPNTRDQAKTKALASLLAAARALIAKVEGQADAR